MAKNEETHYFFNAFMQYYILPWKTMLHSRDSPRHLVCDTGLYLEQNDKVSLLLQFVVSISVNTLDYNSNYGAP